MLIEEIRDRETMERALCNADSENNLRLRLELAGEQTGDVDSATFSLQCSKSQLSARVRPWLALFNADLTTVCR